MEINSFLTTHFRAHYKKLLILGTASLTVYLVKKYMDKKRKSKGKKERKKIKEFPTIEEIQKFIEDLPFDAVNADKTITLKDLLGELSEFSEDEEWKELIASVHTMYDDNPVKQIEEDAGSIMSIYEDPNVITLQATSPRKEIAEKTVIENSEIKDVPSQSKGEGDARVPTAANDLEQNETTNDFEMLVKSSGEGDSPEIQKEDNSSVVPQ